MTDPEDDDILGEEAELKAIAESEEKSGEEQVADQDAYASAAFKRQAVAGDRRSTGHLWLISYADFMTILMIFFLGMYGYAALAKAALDQQRQKLMSYSQFSQEMSRLKGDVVKDIQIREDVGKIVVELPEAILFPSGKSSLTANAERTLEEFGKSLKLVEGEIIVQGHTDNVPIVSSKFKSNWELSASRAFAVIESLTKSGVPAERLAAWGFGENRPLTDNATVEGRARNRRIEIVLLKSTKKEG